MHWNDGRIGAGGLRELAHARPLKLPRSDGRIGAGGLRELAHAQPLVVLRSDGRIGPGGLRELAHAQPLALPSDGRISAGGLRELSHAQPLPLWIRQGVHPNGPGFCGGGVSLSNVYLWCSRKARWLISLSSIEEVAHYAIRANLHIEAFTMLEHTWQSIVWCCAVFLFRVFRLFFQTYDFVQRQGSGVCKFSMAADRT